MKAGKTHSLVSLPGLLSVALTLIILAAGKGSRFGGDKPLASVGPDGQALFEYSVSDAVEAGFNHIVFVVRDLQQISIYAERLRVFDSRVKLQFVQQTLDSGAPSGFCRRIVSMREKPWGTAHAVLVCRDYIDNPFAVINADDYYGPLNFTEVARYLLENSHDPAMCVLPGFQLKNTLSKAGSVNRGVCDVDSDGYLESVREMRQIHFRDEGTTLIDETETAVAGDSIVSMTFWGFHPSIFDLFEKEFERFLDEARDISSDEFYIPVVVDIAIKRSLLRVKVLPTTEQWMGITYPSDVDAVQEFLLRKSVEGDYSTISIR